MREELTEAQRQSLEHSNRLAQELLDRDWMALGVTQEELDQDRLETQWIYTEMDKGRNLEDVLKELDEKIDGEIADKPRRRRTPKAPAPVRS